MFNPTQKELREAFYESIAAKRKAAWKKRSMFNEDTNNEVAIISIEDDAKQLRQSAARYGNHNKRSDELLENIRKNIRKDSCHE